jgi:hypothetical protein
MTIKSLDEWLPGSENLDSWMVYCDRCGSLLYEPLRKVHEEKCRPKLRQLGDPVIKPIVEAIKEEMRPQPTFEVWCQQGGLMEDPHFHWEPMFKTTKSDLGEACRERAAWDSDFRENYSHRGTRHSYWGWLLLFKHDIFKPEAL